MEIRKKEDPKLGTCYRDKNCKDAMEEKGLVSKHKCKEFKGQSWMSQATGICEELDPDSSD